MFIQEEEAKARQAKEEEAAALEFEKWKGEFSIDAEGTTENEVQDGSQGLLFDFVEYIKVDLTSRWLLFTLTLFSFVSTSYLLLTRYHIDLIWTYKNKQNP